MYSDSLSLDPSADRRLRHVLTIIYTCEARGNINTGVLGKDTNLEPVCKEDIEKNETCLTPYVATLCGNIYNSKGFILMIDGVAVMHLTSFMSIVKAMFSSYYVFNIEYPENGHLTLEFMQRCLFNINPQRGSKVQKQKKTKSGAVSMVVVLHSTVEASLVSLATTSRIFGKFLKIREILRGSTM
ncbi:hypothetical protein JTE90_015619 [Oedothorax gibbosus]|uniref:Uncharacterized protein n=1 Tax=Oedothorax gibbosus TaxID=931172 RepID=A0AAV6UVB5_9ARAC|nr:hypothetical protein JTE90_015619 [Oedothorax gibbosus]